MSFVDHFSRVSGAYAAFRPHYPDALFDLLAGAAPARDAAWDCGTGSGQAALGLARYFARVIATDASDVSSPRPRHIRTSRIASRWPSTAGSRMGRSTS